MQISKILFKSAWYSKVCVDNCVTLHLQFFVVRFVRNFSINFYISLINSNLFGIELNCF